MGMTEKQLIMNVCENRYLQALRADLLIEYGCDNCFKFRMAIENDITAIEERSQKIACTIYFLAPGSRNEEWGASVTGFLFQEY